MKPLEQWEAWLVTGSQELYGPDAVRQVEAHAAVIAQGLDASIAIPVRVVCQPVVSGPDAIRRLVLDADSAPNCLGILAWMHTFSPAQMWIPGLQVLHKPLLHLHTQFGRELPWATIDMDFMNLHQSAHGDREFGYVETRLGLARATVVGHWQDAAVQERIAAWSRAARGVAEARSLRVARFGDNMRQVAVTEGDKVEARIRLGVSVEGRGVSELAAAVAATPESSVDELVDDYSNSYHVVPELLPGGERHAALREAARIEAGLRVLLAAGGYRAFTDTFEDLGGLSQLPGIPVQRLMAEGYGFGAEGDWKTAILVRVLKAMAEGLPGGTSFMEDYTYHLDPFAPLILGTHMLEVCPSIAAATPQAEIHPLAIGNRSDPVRLVFTAGPGSGIVVGMLDLGGRFRLVLNEITLVEPPADLPRLPVAHAVWRPAPDLATAAACWLLAGGPHHTALSTALGTRHLVDFAEMTGIELVVIDADTRERRLRDELRWSDAAYRLGC